MVSAGQIPPVTRSAFAHVDPFRQGPVGFPVSASPQSSHTTSRAYELPQVGRGNPQQHEYSPRSSGPHRQSLSGHSTASFTSPATATYQSTDILGNRPTYGATYSPLPGISTSYSAPPSYPASHRDASGRGSFDSTMPDVERSRSQPQSDWDYRGSTSVERYATSQDFVNSPTSTDLPSDQNYQPQAGGRSTRGGHDSRTHSQRRPSNRDEFDGPHQFLDRPASGTVGAQERELLHLPTNLFVQEQDDILAQVNDRLSRCAFDFVAKYQFPIPLESDKRPVRVPEDREWTEWVFLLKRLATKRRIPARVLYNGQIKQLVTVLENSQEMRHAAKHQSRPLKDDRNVLQLISAGIQVAKMLKDAPAMDFLDRLYYSTETLIQGRKSAHSFGA